jgi:hypothetical protein
MHLTLAPEAFLMGSQARRTAYTALLTKALGAYDTFSLLWAKRSGHTAADPGLQRWAAELQPFLIGEEKVKNHRGLRLKGGAGVRRTYAVSQEALAVLAQAKSVFDFSGVWAPEELTFYKNGQVCYAANAHEARET